MEGAIRKWRRDPNHIKFSPIPVGVQNMGGDGRAMLTNAEIQAAEENIIASMGVPKEFIYGGLTHAGGSVTLRMLENQLFTYTNQLKEVIQWVADEACNFVGIDNVTVDMPDFKLVDDIQQKQLIVNVGTQMGILSKQAIAEVMEYDLEEERKRQVQEAVDDAKQQAEIDEKVRSVQMAVSQQIKAQAGGNPLNYDVMAILQVAQEQAMQMISIPLEQRKSMLSQMEKQDPILYAVVLRQLDALHKAQREQGAMPNNAPQDPRALMQQTSQSV
jgi:hypothetical protein